MPQPLSKIIPPPHEIIMPGDAPTRQPELAVLVAQAISIWSLVENTLGGILVDMLGAKASPAIAMYGAIHETARQAALKAAAGLVLSKENHDLLEALMRIHRPLAKQGISSLTGYGSIARKRRSIWYWSIQ